MWDGYGMDVGWIRMGWIWDGCGLYMRRDVGYIWDELGWDGMDMR